MTSNPSRSSRLRRKTLGAVFLFAVTFSPLARAQPDADVAPPKVAETATPEFPEGAAESSAHVVLALVVGPDGTVTDASVLTSGGDAFDRAALDAAKRLRFEPARRGGRAVAARIPFTFDFERPSAPAAPVTAATAPAASPPVPAPGAAPAPSAVPPPAATANPTGEEPVQELDVKGERPPREATTHVLQGEEIRKVPGTNGDLLRSVENLPGVARPPGLSGELLVRGSAPGETGVFLDGTWIIGAYHFGGITSVVPSELIQRLDFHPGNFSPEYGRMTGGVVELELRSPRKDHLGGLLQVDLLDARTIVEGPISKTTRFAVAGRRSWIDAWFGSVAGDGVVAAPVYYDYQAMLEHDFSRNITARFTVFGSDDRMKLLLSSPDAQDPAGGNLGLHDGFYRLQGRVDARLSEDVRWVNKLAWGVNDQSFNVGPLRSESTFTVASYRSDLRARLSDAVAFATGADVLFGTYDVTIDVPPAARESETPVPLYGRPSVPLHGTGTVTRPAVYAMLELRPFDRLLLVPGARVDYMTDTGNWTVDPRISTRLDLAKGPHRTTLKAAAGVFRSQPDPGQSLAPFGNKVRSAWAEHYSLGIEQSFGGIAELSIEGFAKRLHDRIVSVPAADDSNSGLRYTNDGAGRAYGVEWLARWTAPGRFHGWLAYTLSRSEVRDGPGEPYHLFDFDQTHIFTALGNVDLGRGWNFGMRFRYVTGTPYTPYIGSAVDFDAGAYEPIASPYVNSARSAAFHRLDARIEKTWDLSPVKLTAYLDVQNVYNRQPEEGRVYRYDYAKSEPVHGLPILPIVGVRGEL